MPSASRISKKVVTTALQLLGCIFLMVILWPSTANADPLPDYLPNYGAERWVLVGLFNLFLSYAIALFIFVGMSKLDMETMKKLLPITAFVTGVGLTVNYLVNRNSDVPPLPVIAIVELVLLTALLWRFTLLPVRSAVLVACGILVIGAIIGGLVAPLVFPKTGFFYGWWPVPI